MAVRRSLYVLGGAVTALATALWVSAIAPFTGLVAASWGAVPIIHALVVAATAALAILVAAASVLIAADWRADAQARLAWAELAPAVVERSLPVSSEAAWDIDPRYLPAAGNEALGRTFRVHCSASMEPALQTITALRADIRGSVARTESISVQTTRDIGAGAGRDQGISTVSEDGISDRAPREIASTIPAEAPIAVKSYQGVRFKLRSARKASRTRLVANDNAWRRWPARNEYFLTRTPPGKHTADIIVLGSSRDDRTQPLPDASASGTIACGTEPPSCRGPPEVVGHRSPTTETTPRKRSVKSGQASAAGERSGAGPVVRDNLGPEIPLCPAELDVIEIYLDSALRDLLASSAADSEREQA